MGIIRRVTKNYFYLFFAQVACKIFAFCAIVYLARILTPDDFGKISFVSAILSYFLLFTSWGLTTLGTREIAKDPGKISYYTENIISVRLLLSVLAFLCICVLAFFLPKPRDIKILLLLYGLSIFPLAVNSDWIFQGLEKMGRIAFSNVLNFAGYLLLVLIFVKNRGQLFIIPLFWGVGNIIACGVLLAFLIKRIGRINLRFNPAEFKKLLVHAFPIGFSWVMFQVYNNFDTVMLGFMRSQKEVGYYSAAYKIILVISSLAGFFFISIFPVVSNLYKQSIEKLKILLVYTAKLMIALSLPMMAGGIILAKPLMRLFFTSEYDSGIIAFQILICYVGISFLTMLYANSLLACDREKKYAWGVCLASGINLLLNALLIPKFGLAGAAVATVIGEAVLLVYSAAFFSRIASIAVLPHLPKPFLATLLITGLLLFTPGWNLALRMMTAFAVYFTALLSMKFLSREELAEIKNQFVA